MTTAQPELKPSIPLPFDAVQGKRKGSFNPPTRDDNFAYLVWNEETHFTPPSLQPALRVDETTYRIQRGTAAQSGNGQAINRTISTQLQQVGISFHWGKDTIAGSETLELPDEETMHNYELRINAKGVHYTTRFYESGENIERSITKDEFIKNARRLFAPYDPEWVKKLPQALPAAYKVPEPEEAADKKMPGTATHDLCPSDSRHGSQVSSAPLVIEHGASARTVMPEQVPAVLAEGAGQQGAATTPYTAAFIAPPITVRTDGKCGTIFSDGQAVSSCAKGLPKGEHVLSHYLLGEQATNALSSNPQLRAALGEPAITWLKQQAGLGSRIVIEEYSGEPDAPAKRGGGKPPPRALPPR